MLGPTMEFKDYLSIIAIVLSLVSLGVSIRSAQFSRRAKVLEMRATILAKAVEASSRLARINELDAEMRRHAEKLRDFEGFKLTKPDETKQLQERAERAYQRLLNIPPGKGLDVYEEFFHDFVELSEHCARYEASVQETHQRYLALRELPAGNP